MRTLITVASAAFFVAWLTMTPATAQGMSVCLPHDVAVAKLKTILAPSTTPGSMCICVLPLRTHRAVPVAFGACAGCRWQVSWLAVLRVPRLPGP